MGDISYGLRDRVVVVTGGSRGIGRAIARRLLDQGARVVICGRRAEGLETAAAELDGGKRLLAVPAHIARAPDVERLFREAMDAFGALDGLVNNVGMNIGSGVVDADEAVWHKIIDTNLNGTFLCSRKAAQIMRERRRGKIVSITSVAAHRAAPFMGAYGVAKAGVEAMTRALAQELAPFNVQVNAVAPGMVRTGFSRPFWSDAGIHAAVVANIPMGRIAEPEDVVHPVLFLCSRAADFITGQTLMVDGGAGAV